MKKILSLLLVCGFAFSASAVYAGNTNVGIGFGAFLLSGKKGKLFEILASTTNGCSGSQTFSISTGSLGYQEGQAVGMSNVEIFVAQNMDSLATDIARGDGEYVNTLASMLSVKDSNSFKSNLKVNFDKIYTHNGVTSKEVIAHINDINS